MTSSDELRLTGSAREAILAHARASDDEVCGVLVGRRASAEARRDGEGSADEGRADALARVTDVRRVPNVADDPRTRYEFDPVATVDAIDAIEAEGREVVGFYHSHPAGPPRPSETDRARATWDGYVYAIAAPPATVRAWRWTGDAFEPLDVRVDG